MTYPTQLKLFFRVLVFCCICLATLFVFVSCDKKDVIEGYTVYLIKAGEHKAEGINFKQMNNQTLIYDVIFDSSAIYSIKPSNQGDINKLFGFSDCGGHHHENSGRFGWRWYDEHLQIFAYCYTDKKRLVEYIGDVRLDVPYRFIIDLRPTSYDFFVEGISREIVSCDRLTSCDSGLSYQLFPYFGGDQEAPHDMRIFMRRIHSCND